MAPRIVWLSSLVLGCSRLIWPRLVAHQDIPTALRCHVAAFETLGGVPQEVHHDGIKPAVIGEAETDGIVYCLHRRSAGAAVLAAGALPIAAETGVSDHPGGDGQRRRQSHFRSRRQQTPCRRGSPVLRSEQDL